MGYQDDYVMRTISDLVRAIARLALGKNEINYALPDTEIKTVFIGNCVIW